MQSPWCHGKYHFAGSLIKVALMNDDISDVAKRNPLVLVADDEKEARMLLRRILEREEFRVEEAQDGQVTVEKAQELHPDLILMDIQMPNIDGFEAVQMLRDDPRTARIPIIVVTAAAREPAHVSRGLGLGGGQYFRQPYNTTELITRARSYTCAPHLE